MTNYRIVIGSPINYEYLTAEIVFNDEYIVLVQREEGKDKMIVEFYEKKINTKVYLTDLLQALQDARTLLLE